MKRIPTAVFSEWAEIGRDERMAKGHEVAVNNMLEYALKDKKKFSFIDAGCGNGWVVRLVKAHKGCVAAAGVDGAHAENGSPSPSRDAFQSRTRDSGLSRSLCSCSTRTSTMR